MDRSRGHGTLFSTMNRAIDLRPLVRTVACVSVLMLTFTTSASCVSHAPIPPPLAWRSLFDGQSIGEWEHAGIGDEESSLVEDGALHVLAREGVNGVRWSGAWDAIGPPAREGYELRLEAMRVHGQDFFCGLTFPVGTDGRVTLICGGWGGALVGLSSLDGFDASENESTLYRRFDPERWYAIRVRVTVATIECFLDDERVIAVKRSDHEKIDVRAEMPPFLPLGVATFQTRGAYRNIEIRTLD